MTGWVERERDRRGGGTEQEGDKQRVSQTEKEWGERKFWTNDRDNNNIIPNTTPLPPC